MDTMDANALKENSCCSCCLEHLMHAAIMKCCINLNYVNLRLSLVEWNYLIDFYLV